MREPLTINFLEYCFDQSSKEDIKNLAMSLMNSLGICGFIVTKWLSNFHNVLSSLQLSELSPKIVNLDLLSLPIEKALGMSWYIEHDTFFLKSMEKDMHVTKRRILCLVSSIFDSLGILTPSVLENKLKIQDLWRKNIDWDEPIPEI